MCFPLVSDMGDNNTFIPRLPIFSNHRLLHAIVRGGDDLLDDVVATPQLGESVVQVEYFELFQQPTAP